MARDDYKNWTALHNTGKLNSYYEDPENFVDYRWGPTLTEEDWEGAYTQDGMTPKMRKQYNEGCKNAVYQMQHGILQECYPMYPQLEESIDAEVADVYLIENKQYKRLKG
jgi:hypothetical protein